MASQPAQEWQWEDHDGSLKPFKGGVSSKLDSLNVGECYTTYFGHRQYEIKKISHNKCVQRNTDTNYKRNVFKKPTYKKQDNHNNYQWFWKDSSEQLHAYSDDISLEIEKLKLEESYFVFENNKQYQITKITQDKCNQNNIETNYSRDVVRKNKQIFNDNPPNHQDDIKQDFVDDKWYWIDDEDNFNPFDDVISQRIDCLNIGESMMNNVISHQYKLTKSSENYGQQRNVKTNKVREIRKMSLHKIQNHKKNPIKCSPNNDSTDDEKQAASKWYFKDDNGDYKPIDDWLSLKINNLTIGDIMKHKLRNSTYEFKKSSIGKGSQRNIDTDKKREIRIAEYGWFFEDDKKSLKPYSDHLNKQLDAAAINSSFTFSVKIHKYSVKKLSKNHAIQKNLSTKVERNVVKKMILNDNDNDDYEIKSGGDWLQKRYTKAMKSGSIDKVKLVKKRDLKEDSADFHFRTCESQFGRSCDKMGKETNGLNKTIQEVEYIINPKLIKKFEAKKKKLMAKNHCKESELNVVLAWHGTPAANLKNIVENNFDLSKLGVNKKNTGYYGCGIYFSEYARISNNYGDGLLLCKVILGKEYIMKFGKPEIGRTLEPGYDSHVAAKDNCQYGREICIFDADQILPCYIVKY